MNPSYPKKNPRNLIILTGFFISAGILLRLFHFFYNRSLWMDEVYLASSLVKMNYAELVYKTLDYQQKAPIGFLWTVKTFVNLLGTNEMVLRLFPLICGITALFVFVPVARFFLRPFGVVIAIGILSLAPPLIFHSVEIKQYQTELLATLLAFYIYIRYHQQILWLPLLVWGGWGAIILWFSYAAVFILGGIGIALSCISIYRKNWHLFFRQLVPFLCWLVSFVINYFLFTHKHAESKWIVYWFDFYHSFMPLLPVKSADLRWYPSALYHLIDYPLGLTWKFYTGNVIAVKFLLKMPWVPIAALFYGLWCFAKERKDYLVLLVPFLLVFIASGLKLYPLTERFWVFISPLLILFIAKGIQDMSLILSKYKMKLLLPVLLLAGPVYSSLVFLIHPDQLIIHKRSFQREALTFIDQRFRPGDIVYVYWNNRPGYRFYRETYPFKFEAVEGKDYRMVSSDYPDYLNHLKQDFKAFKGKKRIWLVWNDFFHTDIGEQIDQPGWYYLRNTNPTDRLQNYFKTIGKNIMVFDSFDVKVALIKLKDD